MRLLITLFSVFFLAGEALAQSAAPKQPSFGELISQMLPMFFIVFLIFYLLVVKPQQQKLKAQESLLGSLKKGDTVVTSSGIQAKVANIEEQWIVLELAQNVRIRIERGHIARKEEKK